MVKKRRQLDIADVVTAAIVRQATADLDQRNRRLQEDLEHLEHVVLKLGLRRIGSDDGIAGPFNVYGINTDDEFAAWERSLRQTILRLAESGGRRDRAACPLCGDYPVGSPDGFALPLGLERHLYGWGNMDVCAVMAAGRKRARAYYRDGVEHRRRQERKADDAGSNGSAAEPGNADD